MLDYERHPHKENPKAGRPPAAANPFFNLPPKPEPFDPYEPRPWAVGPGDHDCADRILLYTPLDNPHETWFETNALRYNARGLGYFEWDYARAARCFRAAVAADPSLAQAWNHLGIMHLEFGDAKAAVQHFQKAVDLDETMDKAHANQGLAQLEAADLDAAWYSITTAIRLDPENAAHRSNLGVLFLDRHQPQEGIMLFNQAIQLDPDLAAAYSNRSLANIALGDYPTAAVDGQQAYRLHRIELDASVAAHRQEMAKYQTDSEAE